MLTDNKFGKYLLYAVGEIILVVIGILIALSINNQNQEKEERNIEDDYILSLIEDAKTDLSNFEDAIAANERRIKYLDSLESMCFSYNAKDEKDAELMYGYMRCLSRPDFVTQTDRTISQLKNSGGMRLIKDKNKIDAIIKYEETFEKIYNQQVWYEGALKDLVNAGIPIFNYKYLSPKPNRTVDWKTFFKTARLLRTDKTLIIELGNLSSMYNAITTLYRIFLEEGQQECLKLIDILENKKDLEINTEGLLKEYIIDEQILQTYIGKYEVAPEFSIYVTKNGSQLLARGTGWTREIEIYPKSENVFYLKVAEDQFIFNLNDECKVVSLTFLRGVSEFTGLKLKE